MPFRYKTPLTHRASYYFVNSITLYRLLAAVALLYLLFSHQQDVFKWLLVISFFTDAIDGYLARRYKVISVFGAKLDSIADDLTVLMAIIGLYVFKKTFLIQELTLVFLLTGLYLFQLMMALIAYARPTSFHTYMAKVAAVFQAFFLIAAFLFPEPPLLLFYFAAVLTIVDLLEEIFLILLLPEWKADVKGILWILRAKKREKDEAQRVE